MTNVCDKAKEARELLETARALVHLAEIAAGAIEDERPGARWQRGQSIVAAMILIDEKLDKAGAIIAQLEFVKGETP